MITYRYTALSKGGEQVKGTIEAFNRLDAVDRIRVDCDVILNLKEVKEKEDKGLLSMEIGGDRLNSKAFTVMCSQFAIILKAGVPVARTCDLIADKTTDKKLKKILKGVAADVESGRSLSAAFEERGGKAMPLTFIETLKAGEETGNLDSSFDSMYRHYDKQAKMAAKVKNALSYPLFVIAIAIAVVIVLMVKVVPVFTAIFAAYDAGLPLITRMLIAISHFFSRWWIFMVIFLISIFLFLKLYGTTESGRLNLARLQLKLPVLGNIAVLNAASEFSNIMVTMLAAGLPMTRSLSITAKVQSNYYIGNEIGKLSGKLEEGYSLGSGIREVEYLPDILKDMTAVGEETGEMEETLNTIARFYDAELDMAITRALNRLEPTLLIFIAVVAGFIVLAVYITMFQMYAVM